MKRYFLVDCNNFYVSCERVFNPTLYNKPVVVLGSNDACVIARSNEAKALGIGMGAPAFECANIFKKHNVIVYSANFALYGDMSDRVMKTLTGFATDIEIYSVDEAFLFVSDFNHPNQLKQIAPDYYLTYAQHIRTCVKQNTGIPVSVGIGPTKTLAKIANKLAKKNPSLHGAFDITNHPDTDKILASIDVADIWGVGYRYASLLKRNRINNVRDFKYTDEKWVRKNMTVVGHKTLLELRGIACLPLECFPKPKQSITVSRSFGKKVNNLPHLKESVASYMTTAAAKLRAQHALTSHITVFIVTSRYHDPHYYFTSAQCQLPIATNFTPTLIAAAHSCLEKIFTPGLVYRKAGVLLADLMPHDCVQMNTFTPLSPDSHRQTAFMKAIDRINNKWGRDTLFFAAAGIEQPWHMHQAQKSACFTTNWHELLTIKI